MNNEFSNRVKELREVKGYTQKDFANLLGVGQSTVANYERGIRVPDPGKLDMMANLFGVSIDYLFGRDAKIIPSTDQGKTENIDLSNSIETYKAFYNYVFDGDVEDAKRLISLLYVNGVSLQNIYNNYFERIQKEVGVLWEQGEIDVWKEHYISETVLDMMRELKVREKKAITKTYSILTFTAGPEMHTLGLRMLADLLEIDGWNVTYLGSNVPTLSIIRAIEVKKPDIIALSVTMSHHIESAKLAIASIRNTFKKQTPKIIVGGGAFVNFQNVCEETGADYYGVTFEDIRKVGEFIGKKKYNWVCMYSFNNPF